MKDSTKNIARYNRLADEFDNTNMTDANDDEMMLAYCKKHKLSGTKFLTAYMNRIEKDVYTIEGDVITIDKAKLFGISCEDVFFRIRGYKNINGWQVK